MKYFTSAVFFAMFFAVFFLATFSVHAQTPTGTPPDDVLKISTTLIQADVTVTDKDGKVVTDLKPEDFEIYENGKKQEITNFSFVSVDTKSAPTAPVKSPTATKNSIPIPPIKLKAEQVRRTYALVVDDLGLAFPSIFWVKESLKKFVNEQMREGDLVAIIRTGSGIGALQSFTSDKRQLTAAIDKIKWNSYGRSGISTFAPIRESLKENLAGKQKLTGGVRDPLGSEEDNQFEKEIEEFRNENFSVGTLGALNYVIRGMRDLPGRKAVMLFSEGFALTFNENQSPVPKSNRIQNAMRVLADMANRSSVVIYTLDPRGLQVPGMANAEDNIKNIFDASPTAKLQDRNDMFRESQQSLRYLAYETGGFPFINQNSLDLGMRRVLADQSSYYLLGYQPDDETFDPKKNKFNKLEIKLTRPDLKVRYRSGFFGVTDEKIQNVAQTPQQKLMNALTSPFGANGINLSLYPVYQNDAKTGDMIQALVHINAKDLKFTETNGNRRVNFDLVAMTFGDNGIPVDKLLKNYTVEVGEKIYQNMLANGFVYTLPVPIKKAGAYQFRIALRDTNSDNVGSASQFIEVPNFKKRMSVSNLVLDNFTLEEWQKIRLGGGSDNSQRSVLLDTTLRQFKGGTILRYDYVVYNPKQSRSLQTQLRLIRNGKVVYEEQPTPIKTIEQTDLLRLQTAGAISLGKNLEAGDYVLQIIVTDSASEKKFASQFVEFEIVE
ncbi:MAG: VWA domain-containing protein [Acidobacteria bacterium]|nr:VWA domain-containing protein [Acidobacteriota bacterium]